MVSSSTSAPATLPPPTLEQTARETVESIVVAIILAFLFRGFVAEAFVIPTGSMAPTLQGRHMDVVCSQCRFQYRSGASVENTDMGAPVGEITSTHCPQCRFPMELDKKENPNHRSFNGDRILVSKFAYEFSEPQRWDVLVFKFPGNAKINYIKRLVGLPGDVLRIRHGDLALLDGQVPPDGEVPEGARFRILRKPPHTVPAMLQLVHDSLYRPTALLQAGWPESWQSGAAQTWESDGHGGYVLEPTPTTSWLRYRHCVPQRSHWRQVQSGEPLEIEEETVDRLITDHYAYNDNSHYFHRENDSECWVGDLAMDCQLKLGAGPGELTLELVEGGAHFQCVIDPASGQAELRIVGDGTVVFEDRGDGTAGPRGVTPIRDGGEHALRWANIDDQLLLWVDGKLIPFDRPTTVRQVDEVVPRWSPEDPGDLRPAGIAAKGISVVAHRLRILRDVYYRAVNRNSSFHPEYESHRLRSGDNVDTVMSRPRTWERTGLFAARRSVVFQLGPDQFFPLGDNSPESSDARIWSAPPYVPRELLIGRALAIYWPHGWRVSQSDWGWIPNFQRIGLIH